MAVSVYQQGGYGTAGLFPNPVVAPRDPTTSDKVSPSGQPYQVFQGWNNNLTDDSFLYLGGGNWVSIASVVGSLNQLTGDSGTALPSAGSIQIAGTTNQITTVGAGAAITASLPAIVVAPGSVTATTTLTATLGDITATNGNLVLGTAGNKLEIATGANASAGVATLVAGTVTVATTAVTANSIIYLTRQSVGSTGANDLGVLSVGTIVAATSFVINAWTVTDATALQTDDVSEIGWLIVN